MTTPTVTCWRAVHRSQSSNHPPLWITDDVLANAYHGFLKVSQTRKRFGSNVPGPLEAQRRLAKRKLAGLAAARGARPFDFGALFGNGPPTRHELQWQAPRSRPEMPQTCSKYYSPLSFICGSDIYSTSQSSFTPPLAARTERCPRYPQSRFQHLPTTNRGKNSGGHNNRGSYGVTN